MATKRVKPATEFTYGVEIECTLPEAHSMQIGAYYSAGCQVRGLPRGWVAKSDSTIHEKAIFASTGTKKRETGSFSHSIKETWRNRINHVTDLRGFYGAPQGHYRSLNLANLIYGNKPTVEIRAFAGTTNATKICGHVQMAIALVQKGMKSQRRPNWDAPAIADSSRSYRKAGPGSTALARLYYVIGWTKGVSKDLFGYMGDAEGLPTLKEIKKEFSRLGRKYDKATR